MTGSREPTIFSLWALLPSARSVVFAFLALASVAVACVFPIVSGTVGPPRVAGVRRARVYFV